MFTKTPRDANPVSVIVPDPELWAEVAGLPDRQCAAMVLRCVHDLPETTIAELMGLSRDGVASPLAAATASLQRH